MVIQLTEKEVEAVNTAVDYILDHFDIYLPDRDDFLNRKNSFEAVDGDTIRELYSARKKWQTP